MGKRVSIWEDPEGFLKRARGQIETSLLEKTKVGTDVLTTELRLPFPPSCDLILVPKTKSAAIACHSGFKTIFLKTYRDPDPDELIRDFNKAVRELREAVRDALDHVKVEGGMDLRGRAMIYG